ncbi:MAG: N-acetyltransferase family protein [Bacillota bacterium]
MSSNVKFVKTHDLDLNKINVRRARKGDEEGVYRIACSVTEKERDSYQGFLIDDYPKDPEYYIEMFRDRIRNLRYFYVAELNDIIIGFSLAYKKDMWLKYNPKWIYDIHWHPTFDQSLLEDFVLTDKTAIEAEYTGEGIGSKIYRRLIEDMQKNKIHYIFAETVVNPLPNFASLAFRQKQNYIMAGFRYEEHKGVIYSDMVFYKKI